MIGHGDARRQILVYPHREEARGYERYAQWVTEMANGPEPFALSEPVLQEFLGIVRSASKLVADAAHAALAIETGCEWITADTDFARIAPPLRWRHV